MVGDVLVDANVWLDILTADVRWLKTHCRQAACELGTLGMRADDIRKLQDAVPFRPFSLVLADGRAFRVPHPDFLSVSPKGTALSLWDEDGSIGSYLDVALVAEVRMSGIRGKRPKRGRG